jgi:glycosyltransferase involved in cell wall biosynthesis
MICLRIMKKSIAYTKNIQQPVETLKKKREVLFRILMFAPQFAPFANPEAFVNNKLVLAFMAKGWHVDVITRSYGGTVPYDYGSDWTEPWLPLRKITHEIRYRTGGTILKVADALMCAAKTGYLIDGCRWAARAFETAEDLVKKNKYDVIISRAVPNSAHLPAMLLVEKTCIPWIANWNDPQIMPRLTGNDSIYQSISINQRSFLRAVFKRASWHTFPTMRMRNHIMKHLGTDVTSKSSIIPHCGLVVQQRITSKDKNKVFTICHAGNAYRKRLSDVFLKGLTRFFHNHGSNSEKVMVVFVGKGQDWFADYIKKNGLENAIILKGSLTYEESNILMAESDALLILEEPYVEGVFLPAKFVDYVQSGRPILSVSPQNGTMHDILSEHGGGIAADCRSEESVYDAFLRFYESWKEGTLNAQYGSSHLYRLFAPSTILNEYENIFSRLIRN